MLHYSIHDGAFRLKVCLCSSSKTQLKTVLFDCRREDSGLLVYKEHLPVSQVAVGDTNRPGSEAKMTVGPLRCQGDSKSYIATTIYLMLQLFCNKQTTLSEFQFCNNLCHSALWKPKADMTYAYAYMHDIEHWIVDPKVDLV